MTLKTVFFCKFFSILVVIAQSQQQIGKECTVGKTGADGTCTKVYSCKDAIDDIRSNRSPTLCKLRGLTDVACCPNEVVNNFGRISERKCAEYASAVYEIQSVIALVASGGRTYVKKDRCGHTVLPLVIGGTEAEFNEFPHMAIIGFGENIIEWTCGGTLISELYVMTAAHCQNKGQNKYARYVRLGQIDRNFENSQQYGIAKFIVHPRYNPEENYHDIGLIQLDRQVKFKPNIRPACLPKYCDEPVEKAIATGWGSTQFSGPNAHRLLKVTLEKFETSECQRAYSSSLDEFNRIDDRLQICAGSHTESRDTCQGDSGGPLQIYHHSQYCMYTILGVTSFGGTCGTIGVPGVYTKVAEYLNWIESIVWPEE